MGVGRWTELDGATIGDLWRAILLVIVPGLLLVVCLIALAMPPFPPMTIVYGCYGTAKTPTIKVTSNFISVSDGRVPPIPASVERGKEGYTIVTTSGLSLVTNNQGQLQSTADDRFRSGELIPVPIRREQPPSIKLFANDDQIELPKMNCPR